VARGAWRVASGEWRVASGEWRVASGEWRVRKEEERFLPAQADRPDRNRVGKKESACSARSRKIIRDANDANDDEWWRRVRGWRCTHEGTMYRVPTRGERWRGPDRVGINSLASTGGKKARS